MENNKGVQEQAEESLANYDKLSLKDFEDAIDHIVNQKGTKYWVQHGIYYQGKWVNPIYYWTEILGNKLEDLDNVK